MRLFVFLIFTQISAAAFASTIPFTCRGAEGTPVVSLETVGGRVVQGQMLSTPLQNIIEVSPGVVTASTDYVKIVVLGINERVAVMNEDGTLLSDLECERGR
jgi:hypothetical protein